MTDIPRNYVGETIKIYIYDFASEQNFASHAALEFAGGAIDYGPSGFSSAGDDGQHACRVYEIDPAKIGVDPEKLAAAIEQRKNNIKGEQYGYFSENCANQVCEVLREAGATGLPDLTGAGIPTPTTNINYGNLQDKIEDAVGIPVVDDVAGFVGGQVIGRVAGAFLETTALMAHQETLEDYCLKNGKLTEVRETKENFNDISSKFRTYMEILNNPEEYKKSLDRKEKLELQGYDPNLPERTPEELVSDAAKGIQNLFSKKKKSQCDLFNKVLENRTKEHREPTEAEKVIIKAKYQVLRMLANKPIDNLKQRAWELFDSCKNDQLLQDKLWDIAVEAAPNIAIEKSIHDVEVSNRVDAFLRRMGVRQMEDTTPRSRTVPSNRSTPETGRA